MLAYGSDCFYSNISIPWCNNIQLYVQVELNQQRVNMESRRPFLIAFND